MSLQDTVFSLWDAMSTRDWATIKSLLSEDCLYTDMPVGPTLAARGPDDIVKRLRLALDPVAEYTNHRGLLVDNGVDAIYEHAETWKWASGEIAFMEFATVHKVVDGKITLWKDYWDYAKIMDVAPQSWHEAVANGDMSWIYDATGQM